MALPSALSVGELTRRIKKLIEDHLRFVWVAGEISNFRHAPSGHLYFTLKDEEAQIPCAMWKGFAARLRFQPADGMQVVAGGRVEVYAPHGKYQLVVEQMEPQGIGALQLRFEQLKERLGKEGLFDAARKRPLPRFPETIAIVTSPAAAALRDMLRILTTRYPKVSVLVVPVAVQGEEAPAQISRAVAEVNLQRPDVDVMIVGRGGGSLEDLWAFNEEIVARAIHGSRIPVVSAVGHETDVTIADFVADVRAATPTDAANRVVPDLQELTETLRLHAETLERRPRELFGMGSQRTDELQARLGDALGSAVRTRRDRLFRLEESLVSALPRLAVESRRRLDLLSRSGGFAAPGHAVRRHRESLGYLASALHRALERMRAESRRSLEALSGRVDALSPLRVLARGYSLTTDASGKIVRSAATLKSGDEIRSRLAEGTVRSRVEKEEDPST